MIIYKVITVKEREDTLETVLNRWSLFGWKLNCIQTEHTTQIVVFEKGNYESK